MKKILIFLLFLIILPSFNMVFAEVEESDVIDEIISSIDTSQSDKDLQDLGLNFNLKETIKQVINGEKEFSLKSFLSLLSGEIFTSIKSSFNTFFALICIIILSAIIDCIKPDSIGLGEIVFYVVFCSVVIVLVGDVFSICQNASKVIKKTYSFISVITPIIFTTMTLSGGVATIGIFKPAVAFIEYVFLNLTTKWLLPISTSIICLSCIGNVSSVKLDKLKSFLCSLFKWCIGLSFTFFSFFITAGGISSSIKDGLYFKLGKYTVSNSIPIVGGFLGGSLETLVASAVLIKNSLGFISIYFIMVIILSPLIEIVVLSLVLNLLAGLMENFTDKRIISVLTGISSGLGYVSAVIIFNGLICLVSFVLLICCGNVLL